MSAMTFEPKPLRDGTATGGPPLSTHLMEKTCSSPESWLKSPRDHDRSRCIRQSSVLGRVCGQLVQGHAERLGAEAVTESRARDANPCTKKVTKVVQLRRTRSSTATFCQLVLTSRSWLVAKDLIRSPNRSTKVWRVAGCCLLRHRVHKTQHVFGAVVHLTHKEFFTSLSVLLLGYVEHHPDNACGASLRCRDHTGMVTTQT